MLRREMFVAAAIGAGGVLLAGSQKSAAQTAGSRLARILDTGVLRVGTTGDVNPLSFRDVTTNSLQGYDIDTMELLASDMGVQVEWVAAEWATITAGVAADRYDVFSGAGLSVQRARVAAFTVPIDEVGTVPMSLAQNAGRYPTWEAINAAGTRVSILMGTTFEGQARQYFPDATIQTVQSPATGWQDVLAGRADVTLTSNIEAGTLVRRFPELAITVGVEGMRNRSARGYVVAQDDPVWLHFLNTWVRLKQIEGYYAELNAKWLGP